MSDLRLAHPRSPVVGQRRTRGRQSLMRRLLLLRYRSLGRGRSEPNQGEQTSSVSLVLPKASAQEATDPSRSSSSPSTASPELPDLPGSVLILVPVAGLLDLLDAKVLRDPPIASRSESYQPSFRLDRPSKIRTEPKRAHLFPPSHLPSPSPPQVSTSLASPPSAPCSHPR